MIIAVTGHPGSGKSFYIVNRAYKAIKKGRIVFSNIAIKGAYKIEFDDLVRYDFPAGSVVVIDEAGRWFNSRKWKDLPDRVFDLFTLHRHFKLDLIIAVQNFARIDIALREVIELTYWSESLWYLPYRLYYGYYDVEKVGGLKHYDFIRRISKYSKSRNLYDTHEMEKEKIGEDMPLIPWYDETIDFSMFRSLRRKFKRKG